MTEETLFELALNTPAADRPALLDRRCAGDPALRARVEALLAAHERLAAAAHSGAGPTTAPETASGPIPATAGDAAFRPPVEATAALTGDATAPPTPGDLPRPPTPDDVPAEGVGSLLAGKYKVIEEIGEGGMGAVFLAQQTAPVRRAVAVKVIKAGMDSRAVLARFDAERQALALMDHPNIARVLDAGATDSGRPFFVMELVKGIPITQFCDERRLTPRQRLELFVPVCQAIQHAHQKGVIHRDIKPSNVLVALYDDRPVPKVIDFGIAKATEAPLTDHSQVTGFGAVVGTPEYMSPEQASLNNLDIDTRSDVYALGVLLYELLTGTTPVDRKSLGRAAILEVLRIVREVESPRPSTRLSALDGLPSIAASRSVEPARLAGLLRGELDWIALKALEKDRARRYETANALARDVQRYLADEVVEARPPSAGYRLRKFARRHKGRVVAAGLVLLALVVGMIGTSWGYLRAERARGAEPRRAEGERLANREAQQQKDAAAAANAQAQKRLAQIQRGNQILTGIFAELNINNVKQGDRPLEAVLADRLVRAAEQLEGESVGDPLLVATMQEHLGESLRSLGFGPEAIPMLVKALATTKAQLGTDHRETLAAMCNLAACYQAAGKFDRSLPLFEEALRLCRVHLGTDEPTTLATMNSLAENYLAIGQHDRALPLLEEALRLLRARFGFDHPDTVGLINNLAVGYINATQQDRALSLLEQSLPSMKARFGPDHPNTLLAMQNLAVACDSTGHYDRAVPLFEEIVRLQKARLGPDHPSRLTTMGNLAQAYRHTGKFDLAVPLMEENLRLRQAKLGTDHPDTLTAMDHLAGCYQDAGRLDRALRLYEETLRLYRARLGPDHYGTLRTMANLAAAYWSAHRLDRSIPLFEEAVHHFEKTLGRNHPDTLRTVANLGINYNDAGRPAEGLPLLEEAYRAGRTIPGLRPFSKPLIKAYARAGRSAQADALIEAMRADLGPDHPDTLEAMNHLATAYWSAHRLDRSIPLFEEALKLMEKKRGRNHFETLRTVANLGVNYNDAGRLAEGLPLLEEAYRAGRTIPALRPFSKPLLEAYAKAGRSAQADALIEAMRADLGPDHPDTLKAMNDLAMAYWTAHRLDRSIPLFEEALKLMEKKWGRNHPETLQTVANLGVNYNDAGRVSEALPLLEEAHRASRTMPTLRGFDGWLLHAYVKAGRSAEAAALVKELMAVARKALPEDSPQRAGMLAQYGYALLQAKAFADAEPILRECLAIRVKGAPEDPRTLNTRSLLGGALLGQKKYAEAEPLLLQSYEGMKARKMAIPPEGATRLPEAIDRLIELYTATGQPEEARRWRTEREQYDKETGSKQGRKK